MISVRYLPIAAVLAVVAAGCGGDKPVSQAPPAGAERVDASKAGDISGRVLIEGAVPPNPTQKISSDAACMRDHGGEYAFENYIVSDGGLDNVFVYVKDGLGKYYFEVPAEAAKLDQQGCRYMPHVIGVRVGQPLQISNSDDTMHNVHALPNVNREFNFGQAFKGISNTRTFTAPEVMVHFKCDVHGWMSAYVGVVEHPYFAVTTGGGRFELKGVPAGTYTVEAWHEKAGAQTQQVTIGEKETKSVTFTFKGPTATN